MGNTPGKVGGGARSRAHRQSAQQEPDPYAQPDPFADHPAYRSGGGGGARASNNSGAHTSSTGAVRSSRTSAERASGGKTRTENRESRNRSRQQQASGRSRSPTGTATGTTTSRAKTRTSRQSRTSAGSGGAARTSASAAAVPSTTPQAGSSQPPRSTNRSRASAGTGSSPRSSAASSSSNTASQQSQQAEMFSRREKMKKKDEMSAESAKMFVSAQSVKASDIPQPDSTSGKSFDELYRLKEVLGTGAFSTVREGYHRRYRERMFAVKCVNRSKLTDEDAAALLDEVAILKEMRHSHIIRLYDFFEEPANYYLVMEKMTGGELFDRIVAKAYYNEKEARDTCRIILEAVGYCHKHKIAHRDLKPENLLLVSDDSDSSVKIADFGFAKKVLVPKSLQTQCGTPGYVAPEILEGTPYDTKADMWSVGVILYILLGGYPPFIENNQRELFRKIRRGDYEFHEEYWSSVSSDAKNLISSLLTVDPSKRLDAKQALRVPWMVEADEALAGKDLGTNLTELRKFNAKRKFRAAVSTVMAANKLQSLGKDFLKNLD